MGAQAGGSCGAAKACEHGLDNSWSAREGRGSRRARACSGQAWTGGEGMRGELARTATAPACRASMCSHISTSRFATSQAGSPPPPCTAAARSEACLPNQPPESRIQELLLRLVRPAPPPSDKVASSDGGGRGKHAGRDSSPLVKICPLGPHGCWQRNVFIGRVPRQLVPQLLLVARALEL